MIESGCGFKILADAIIVEACRHYEFFCKKENKTAYDIKQIKDDIEFFKSDWFKSLSPKIDGNYILKKLDEKIEKERKNEKTKK